MRSTLVTYAAVRLPIAFDILASVPRGTTISADSVRNSLSAIREAATGLSKPIAIEGSALVRLQESWNQTLTKIEPLVTEAWLKVELEDEDGPLIESVFDRIPSFQKSIGPFNPRMTHCAGKTIGERYRAELLNLFLPLPGGMLQRL